MGPQIRRVGPKPVSPDLQSQWESLLDTVWKSEVEWDLLNRIDLAVLVEENKNKKKKKCL